VLSGRLELLLGVLPRDLVHVVAARRLPAQQRLIGQRRKQLGG
jgi:hypothetical protein